MKYSILIPAYNAAEYIGQCLNSILAQTTTDYEVIILNDGSTDDTASICLKYALLDKRIKFVSQDNKGVAHSRNRLLDMAAGEWIVFIDADDYVTDDYLACFDRRIALHPEIDVFICNIYSVRNGSIKANQPFKGDKKCYYSELLKKRYWKAPSGLWAKAIRRSLVQRHHIRCSEQFNLGEDLFFLIVLLYYTDNIDIDNQPKYFYRKHERCITRNTDYMKDSIVCYQAIIDFIRSKQNAREYEQSLNWGKMRVKHAWYLSVRRLEQSDASPFIFEDVHYKGLSVTDKIRLYCIHHDLFNTIRMVNRIIQVFS